MLYVYYILYICIAHFITFSFTSGGHLYRQDFLKDLLEMTEVQRADLIASQWKHHPLDRVNG